MKYNNLEKKKAKLKLENSLVDLYLECDSLEEFKKRALDMHGYVSYALDPFHRAYWRKNHPAMYGLALNAVFIMLSAGFGLLSPVGLFSPTMCSAMFIVLHIVNMHVGERVMSSIEWNENGRPVDY